ncbi:hypothetical protein BGZ57DRAFT_861551 [Hyaloscypha finlandica]|nr:hypothetical protein BGZ57DRAFT_861551 [Hyaloscypha finlandica]
MAEAMALIGLASSIVTFLDLSAKIIVFIHECKASASLDRFHDIESQLPLLCKIFEGMQDDIKSQNLSQATADTLKQAVQGCLRQAMIIEDLVQQTTVDPTESKVKQVFGAVKRVQKNKKLGEA